MELLSLFLMDIINTYLKPYNCVQIIFYQECLINRITNVK